MRTDLGESDRSVHSPIPEVRIARQQPEVPVRPTRPAARRPVAACRGPTGSPPAPRRRLSRPDRVAARRALATFRSLPRQDRVARRVAESPAGQDRCGAGNLTGSAAGVHLRSNSRPHPIGMMSAYGFVQHTRGACTHLGQPSGDP